MGFNEEYGGSGMTKKLEKNKERKTVIINQKQHDLLWRARALLAYKTFEKPTLGEAIENLARYYLKNEGFDTVYKNLKEE